MNKVGIIGAMELEVAELKSKMQVKNVVEKAGMKFHEGVLKSQRRNLRADPGRCVRR